MLLLNALLYVGAAVLAGAAGTALYWNTSSSAFLSHPPVTFDRFAIDSAAAWVWIPAAFLLGTNHSFLTPLIAGVSAMILGLRLREAIPETAIPDRPATEMFDRALRTPRREWHGLLVVLCVVLSGWCLSSRLLVASALLLAVGGFVFGWNYKNAPADAADIEQGNRDAIGKLLRATGPAVLVTTAVLAFGFAGMGHQLVGLANASASTVAAVHTAQHGPQASAASSYHSIILWPPEQKNQPIAPPPDRSLLLIPGEEHPLIIRFDGPYWYFQAPSHKPGPHAHRAHGSPMEYRFQASGGPLTMEAHQQLGGEVPLADCGEIQMEIANRNNRPGVISLGLLLEDTAAPRYPSVYLGQQPVVSSVPENFAFKADPVTETLRYSIPPRTRLRTFNQIIVIFLPERAQSHTAPEIAVRQFAIFR